MPDWTTPRFISLSMVVAVAICSSARGLAEDVFLTDSPELLTIKTPELEAAVSKQGFVSGLQRQSFIDRRTGCRDLGPGLDVVDWIMEPGSDEAYSGQLEQGMVYEFNNLMHGGTAKRKLEGPQICTRAKHIEPVVIRGKDFTAVRQQFRYLQAAPGKNVGSLWTQWIVFPAGKRYFVSMDRIDAVNSSDAMFLRIDMPGHIRHKGGDTFSEIYLSYHGRIPSQEFKDDFPPDARFNYRRGDGDVPERFIRAYRIRDPQTGGEGPWLAGMTLDPDVVHEAWCHQRGYVCLIEEVGGRPVQAGESFSAAFIVGYFDSIKEMEDVYDQHRGFTGLSVTLDGWSLTRDAGTTTVR
jgi:hypothetical protein